MHSVLLKVELLLVIPGHQVTGLDRGILTPVLCISGQVVVVVVVGGVDLQYLLEIIDSLSDMG